MAPKQAKLPSSAKSGSRSRSGGKADAEKGFDTQDKNIIRYVIDKGKGLLLIINKWDLIKDKKTNTMKNIKEDIIYQYPAIKHYPIQFISIK